MLKRRRPGFNESYHGFKSFGQLLEHSEQSGLVKILSDKNTGGHIIQRIRSDD